MINAKENYKKWHPDQFSDSKTIKKANLSRDFLEYHLSKISGHSQEKTFERFCKAILEAEVCPNLLPQTGPTGGGDSKVDTETYPVAEQLTESWLYGNGNKSGSERWAFAISSKADWRSKMKSDVEKIAETINNGRKYTKIFFVSNQLISDKKRADIEDELRNKYDIDIRIFSMDWLLEAVFKNATNQLIAVKTLGLSESLVDEKFIGEKDYKRQNELEEIENALKSLDNLKASKIIDCARRSVILSRELEKDEQETLARIDRYIRFSKEYGSTIDQANAIYESAKTVFWWYPSATHFYAYYKEFEIIASNEKTSYLFEKLCILWLNLFSITQYEKESGIDVERHRHIIESIYEFLVSNENKPNTILSAKTSLQMIRLARGDSLAEIVNDYIDIVQNSENSLVVDVGTIADIIQRNTVFQEANNYDQLFDLIVTRLSKEKRNSEAAKMNAMRGEQLIDSDPFRSLSFFSKAVLSFHNEANTDLLMHTVYLMGHLYENLGLHWAARNYFFYVVTYCLNEYMKKGEITSFFPAAANNLKWIELKQGRVIFSSEMHIIELLARNAYPDPIPDDINNFDALLAFPIFQTPFEKIRFLGKLPQYFDKKGLPLSATACRYELGYYDKDVLQEYGECKEKVDEFMKTWANQPAWNQIRYEPWYGFEKEMVLQSRIMGCAFYVRSANDMFTIEFATTLLSTLECFLGTCIHNEMVSRTSVFEIEILKVPQENFSIEVDYCRDNPTYMLIKTSQFNDTEFQHAHELFSSKLIEIISIIISVILVSNEDYLKFKEIIDNEFVLARTQVFTDSLFYGYTTFGPEMFSYSEVVREFDEEPLIRTQKAVLHEENELPADGETDKMQIIFDVPPDYSPKQYKNDEVLMTDIINIPLWDISKWCGTMFLFHPNYLPVLSLMFSNESGLKIFDEWIKKYGSDDQKNAIGIRIIKGINYNHPHWYRIGIGANSFFSQFNGKKSSVVISPCRMHTMQPENSKNIEMFEQIQSRSGDFIICPCIIKDGEIVPGKYMEKQILKHAGSLKIIHAYEVEKTDTLAVESIIPGDKPLIPPGHENCDLIDILAHKNTIK